jgi:hypothetical protein
VEETAATNDANFANLLLEVKIYEQLEMAQPSATKQL